jgi:predicted DNA-binding transcriptional regulator AlpA
MAKRILREPEVCARLGCKRTKFRLDYRLNHENDPFVPGSDGIPRLPPLHLGPTAIGFDESAVDALISALVAAGGHTNSKGTRKGTRTTRVLVTDSKRERRRRS